MIRNRKKIVDMIFNFIFHKFPVILERTAGQKGVKYFQNFNSEEAWTIHIKIEITGDD